MIRTLLAPMLGVHHDASTLALAAELGRHFHAHICIVAPDEVGAAGVAERRQRFDDWRSAQGFREPLPSRPRALTSASFHELSGPPETRLPRRAQFADLICLATPAGEEDPGKSSELVEALVFWSGRPVLLVPVGERYAPGTLLGAPSVVGWNGSPEAVHAVAAAIPFLQVSERIEVITIDEEASHAADAYELASYLSFHGIPATGAGIGRKDWTGEDVLDVAVGRDAGLLVMGARRHTGARALGSATRRVLAAKAVPVLMAS